MIPFFKFNISYVVCLQIKKIYTEIYRSSQKISGKICVDRSCNILCLAKWTRVKVFYGLNIARNKLIGPVTACVYTALCNIFRIIMIAIYEFIPVINIGDTVETFPCTTCCCNVSSSDLTLRH